MSDMKYLMWLQILLTLNYSTNGLPKIDPLVETQLGLIRGLSSPNGDYSMFLGIPYATVNTSNPFGPSIPHPRFDSTFEAYDDSAMCPQFHYYTNEVTGTLDCLHINVYVPHTATSTNRLPVMVWFYEGGFSRGFAGRYVYGPSYLVKHDVILVTVNYRLGPYGFMCLDTPDVPGNQGLKDQLTALRWIKNNIVAFGGDVDKITLFGQSAGSASNEFHFLYTKENLFNNIILQSGAVYVVESNTNVPLEIAQYLGFDTNDVNDALNFLTTVNTDLVIAAVRNTNLRLGPCVEKQFENIESLITDHPLNTETPNAENTSIMIGVTNQEALSVFANQPPEFYEAVNIFSSISQYFKFEPDYLKLMEDNIRQFYIGEKPINEDIKWDLIDFASDCGFVHPSLRQFKKYDASGVANIYYYIFSYSGNRNLFKTTFGVTEAGAAHTDELGYLFDVSFFNEIPTAEDQLIIDRITTLWTNFAKYSNPTPEVTDVLPVLWPKMTQESMSYLNIDLEMEVQQRPYHNRMAYWDIFFMLNKKYQTGYQEIL